MRQPMNIIAPKAAGIDVLSIPGVRPAGRLGLSNLPDRSVNKWRLILPHDFGHGN